MGATDELDIAEFHSREAARFSLDGLNAARARAHALLLVLLGGGAGMGSLGLAQMAQSQLLAVAALSAAVWWFALAGYVVLKGLRSATVRSWAVPTALDWFTEWDAWASASAVSTGARPDPLPRLRQRLCAAANSAASEYRAASGLAYQALDRVYLSMSLTPLACAAGVVAWRLYQALG